MPNPTPNAYSEPVTGYVLKKKIKKGKKKKRKIPFQPATLEFYSWLSFTFDRQLRDSSGAILLYTLKMPPILLCQEISQRLGCRTQIIHPYNLISLLVILDFRNSIAVTILALHLHSTYHSEVLVKECPTK